MCRQSIILRVGNCLHCEVLLIGPDEDKLDGALYPGKHPFPPAIRFCFEAAEINCLCFFLYAVSLKSFLNILTRR